ncbi:MFS transporter [Brucella pseudogrignonensis]|jgi:MFS family permease|uniref:MFS transporter n=1 Tax=Brucella pseudogrignonensis TaxID=419475 RepID=UPI00124DE4BF|nr:MFS transporter [Brucella pseudogrignonensis]KAB2689123.1 MFS transporter [Brucella pseudogrignonensis]
MGSLESGSGCKSNRAMMVHFLAGMLVSNIGRNAYFVCIIWCALNWGNNARLVPSLLFVSTLSQFLVSGLSGFLADIADRRYLAIGMDAVRAVIIALTGYAIRAEMEGIVLFLSIALYSVADRGYLTAMQSMIPRLPWSAVTTNSASYLMMQSGTFLGAGLAGILLHFLSYGAVLSLISCTFILSGTLLATKPSLSFYKDPIEPGGNGRLKYTFSIMHLNKYNLVAPTLVYSFSFGVGILVNTLLAVYVLEEMNGNAILFGKFESAWALGGILVSLVLAFGVRTTFSQSRQPGLLFYSGSALVLLWIFPFPIPVAIVLVLLSAIYNLSRIRLDVQVQQSVSTATIGRVKGAINSIATGTGLLIYVLIGIIGNAVPPSHILAGYGFCAIIAAATLTIKSRSVCQRSDRN